MCIGCYPYPLIRVGVVFKKIMIGRLNTDIGCEKTGNILLRQGSLVKIISEQKSELFKSNRCFIVKQNKQVLSIDTSQIKIIPS